MNLTKLSKKELKKMLHLKRSQLSRMAWSIRRTKQALTLRATGILKATLHAQRSQFSKIGWDIRRLKRKLAL
jgi:hypothetical protein